MIPAIWTGRPVIFHLHGGGFLQFYEEECGFVTQRIIRYVLDNATRIIVLSESWATTIATITKNREISVVVNPAMPFHVVPGSTARIRGTLLFLGRLGRPKGIYVLLDALARLVKHQPDVRLVCGGDGELDEVRREAKNLGLDDRVEILGWIGEIQRAKLLATASIYVLPSFAEGLPMSILEAMSAGLPVVSTPIGGIPEAITDGEQGFLVPAGNAEALSDAICKILNDDGLRDTMGANSLAKFNACFSANVVLPRLESIYRDSGVVPVGSS